VKTVVFVGPTVTAQEVRAVLPDADVRGPAACGDVLRVVHEGVHQGPAIIALVDGFFEHRLPVWHKELLWALSRGCPVYGASSMGALRAAELAAFGMVGVGQIFAWYRDGVLEDDDEVAVAHEDEATGYRVHSDAMVNVRATLARLVEAGILDPEAAKVLTATLKATPYPQRNLRQALSQIALPAATRAQLAAWWQQNGLVDQKHADALLLFQQIADRPAPPPARPADHPTWAFSYTESFHQLVRSLDVSATESPTEPSPEDLLEELQLRGPVPFHACWQAALEQALSRALGVRRPEEAGAAEAVQEAVLAELPSVLRQHGLWEDLARRAADKSRLLQTETRPAVRMASAEVVAAHCSRLGLPIPENLEDYARALGFEDQQALIVSLARERWYLERTRST